MKYHETKHNELYHQTKHNAKRHILKTHPCRLKARHLITPNFWAFVTFQLDFGVCHIFNFTAYTLYIKHKITFLFLTTINAKIDIQTYKNNT